MDYNTQREHLALPEYGRHIQQMVEYLLTIEDREKRNEQAALVVRVMLSQNPQTKRVEEQERKVWEHLYIISGYKLDVDSKFPMHKLEVVVQEKSELHYPVRQQRVNHYGHLIPKMLKAVSDLPTSEEQHLFALQTANQMKRSYLEWNKSTVENSEILTDVTTLSGGKLDLGEIELDEITLTPPPAEARKKNISGKVMLQQNMRIQGTSKHFHSKNKKRR
jgi:hypothetical protein